MRWLGETGLCVHTDEEWTMESGQGLQQGKQSPVLDILDFDRVEMCRIIWLRKLSIPTKRKGVHPSSFLTRRKKNL